MAVQRHGEVKPQRADGRVIARPDADRAPQFRITLEERCLRHIARIGERHDADRVSDADACLKRTFDARKASNARLAARAEAAMLAGLGRRFDAVVRSQEELQALLAADAFAQHALPKDAKRVVSFLREPGKAPTPALPVEQDGARILQRIGAEVYTFYTPTPKGPVFMQLLERHFGKDITTRTWDTVRKCASA